jgi:diphthine-ammonia ligase
MKVAMSWTGGKDCALACYKALKSHNVALFVHFDWETPSPSHPQAIAKLQAQALNAQFLWLPVKPPYLESYHKAIIQLKQEYGIEGIVTGDITVDAFHGAWMDDLCKGTGVQVIKPLWEQNRKLYLKNF